MTHLERWWKSNRLLTSNWWRSIIRGMMQCLSASMTPLMFSTNITKLRMPSRGRPAQTLHTCVGCQRVTAQWDKRDVALRNIMSHRDGLKMGQQWRRTDLSASACIRYHLKAHLVKVVWCNIWHLWGRPPESNECLANLASSKMPQAKQRFLHVVPSCS